MNGCGATGSFGLIVREHDNISLVGAAGPSQCESGWWLDRPLKQELKPVFGSG